MDISLLTSEKKRVKSDEALYNYFSVQTLQELYVAARIGEWMIVEGLLSAREVELIVDSQDKGDHRLFGEIAVAHAYITPFDVQRFLSLQDDKEEKN